MPRKSASSLRVRAPLLTGARWDCGSVEGPAAHALELAARLGALPGWTLEKTHVRFGTATLRAPGGLRVDVAATRREEYPAPASLPVVTGTTTIEDDLGRRDFTMHAMARRVGRRGLV